MNLLASLAKNTMAPAFQVVTRRTYLSSLPVDRVYPLGLHPSNTVYIHLPLWQLLLERAGYPCNFGQTRQRKKYPGARLFTVIPSGASSTAMLRARCATAAFEALYAACGCGRLTISEDILEMRMIRPCVPVDFICLATAWAVVNRPKTLISKIFGSANDCSIVEPS